MEVIILMYIDFHSHFDSSDPAKVREFVNTCHANECMAAMCGGRCYGGKGFIDGGYDMVPNDDVIKLCHEYSDTLIPLAKIDLWDGPVDLSELRRWVDMGAKGIKLIYPYYHYDDDRYMPFYEEAEKLGLPLLFHTGLYTFHDADAVYHRPVQENMSPLCLDRIARSFPKLNIVAAHLGTELHREQCAIIVQNLNNLYFDLAGGGNFWAVTPERLAHLMKGNADWARSPNSDRYRKMIFGSDSYVSKPAAQKEAIWAYRNMLFRNFVSDEDFADIMGGTVASWMGIKLN